MFTDFGCSASKAKALGSADACIHIPSCFIVLRKRAYCGFFVSRGSTYVRNAIIFNTILVDRFRVDAF